MPYNGGGVFTPVYNWTQDKINGIKIRADRFDGQDGDIATGLSTAICKDGQQIPTANLPMGTFKHTGVGAATNATDYLRADQDQNKALTFYADSGAADAYVITPVPAITSLFGGQTWFVRIANTNLTVSPTLAVSGLTAKTIVNGDLTPMIPGQLVAGGVYPFTYEAAADKYLIAGKNSQGVLVDGGLKTSSFTAASNNRYRVKGTTVANVVQLPVGTPGDLILLVIYGAYGTQICGTINGINSTLPISQQSIWLGYTSTTGWV